MSYFETVADANVRSGEFFIARTVTPCSACRRLTRVIALAVPVDHDTLEPDSNLIGDQELGDLWQNADFPAWLFFIADISEAARSRMQSSAAGYHRVRAVPHGESYWANHCQHCGVALDDHELYCEPGGAFMPMTVQEAEHIELERVTGPVDVAAGGYSVEPVLFRHMRTV